ncbi:hypothetical protein [Streptomyces sp. NPDC127084]|uniref:hypothetical protein n=1 Tax=Streptomyces sp. NPDC127084 TaxID=3347133 RepID=UPI00364C9AC8
MNKNIRRSIAVAAGAAGMWAIGTAAASADELPSLSLSTPDQATDVAQDKTADVVDIADAADVDHSPAVSAATGTARDAAASKPVVSAASAADLAQDQVRQQAGDTAELPAIDTEIDYLFGPLSAFAPELEQAPAHAHSVIGATGPVVDETAQDVLPPIAGRALDGVAPVAGQAVGDAAGLTPGPPRGGWPLAGGGGAGRGGPRRAGRGLRPGRRGARPHPAPGTPGGGQCAAAPPA